MKTYLNKWMVLCLVALVAGLPVQAGIGESADGKLTLHVYFTYREDDPRSWDDIFTAYSQLLYTSLDGQLQIGKVKYFNGVAQAKDAADIWILESPNAGAYANLSGLGVRGSHITISNRHKENTDAARGPFGLLHESGHYLFGLGDEYGGQIRVKDAAGALTVVPAGQYMWRNGDFPGVPASNKLFYCTDRTGNVGCIMDGGTTVFPANQRRQFCWSGNHVTGKGGTIKGVTGTYWWVNNQEHEHGCSCWEHISGQLGVTAPAGAPAGANLANHQELTFEVLDAIGRLALCIDHSGSMDGDPLEQAKEGATVFVNLVQKAQTLNGVSIPGDHLAIVQFDDSASIVMPLTEVTSDTVKADARSAIAGISSGGSTSIGGGLEASLAQITGGGANEPGCTEVIVLLSDGQENASPYVASVLPSVSSRKVKVYTIGLGDGVDVALMEAIAQATGGKFIYAPTSSELIDAYLLIWGDLDSAGVTGYAEDQAEQGNPAIHSVVVDGLTEQVTFSMNAGNAGVLFSLTDPAGVVIHSSMVGARADIEYADNGKHKYYRVQHPLPGTWQLRASVPLSGVQTASGTASPAAAINDNKTITNSIVIAESFSVGEIQVPINVTHTFIGDLAIDLLAPNGVKVRLHNQSGGSVDNIVGTYGVDLTSASSLSALFGQNAAGTWRLIVADNAGGDTGVLNSWGLTLATGPVLDNVPVTLTTLSSSKSLQISAAFDQETYAYPDPMRLLVNVVAERPVLGCTVTATVQRPDGTKVEILLYDDGNANHGDAVAGDATYSGLFAAYSASGVYGFDVHVKSEDAYYMLPNESDPDSAFEEAPAFERTVSKAASVSDVPAIDTTGLRVEKLTAKFNTKTADSDSVSISGKFEASDSDVDPASDTFTLTIGRKTIRFTPAELKQQGASQKFSGLKGDGTGTKLTLDLFMKGTSKCRFTATIAKDSLNALLTPRAALPVTLAYGSVDGELIIEPTLLKETGDTGFVFDYKKNDMATRMFYVDSLAAKTVPAKPSKTGIYTTPTPVDSLTLVGSFPGFGTVDPGATAITITLNDLNFTFQPSSATALTLKGKGWFFKGMINGAVVDFKLDAERRIFTLKVSKLDLSALTQVATLGFTTDSQAALISVKLGVTGTKGKTYSYR